MYRLAVIVRQFLRRLLHRPPPAPTYPRTVEGVLSSGRRYRFTIKSDPRTWPDAEPAFTAPTMLERDPDDDPAVDSVRPKLIPGMAVSLAAARQHVLELAGLADDNDEDQERDRRLVWWFRRQRDQQAD